MEEIKLNERDQKVDSASGGKITQAKKDWNIAKGQYDKATNDADRQKAQKAMNDANKAANDARSQFGNYTAGTSGTDYVPTGGGTSSAGGGGGGGSKKPTLNAVDSALLDANQQAQLLDLKGQYQEEYNKGAGASADVLADLNRQANLIRAQAGYSGGTTGNDYTVLAAGQGGKTYQQLQDEWNAYVDKWYRTGSQGAGKYWQNGFSTDMNVRARANRARQQMEANEKAMVGADEATRDYLHAQNMEIAKNLLGGTTYYNDSYNNGQGRWETWNSNIGYGYDMAGTQPNIRNDWKKFYGYTDEEIENWANDTRRYYNFVDTGVPARNTIDESSGFTGMYAQFVNGPYIPGTHYETMTDVYGDGFGDEGTFMSTPQYDENGNIIKTPPALKGNNSASAYTQQFLPVVVKGTGLVGGTGAKVDAMDPTVHDNNIAGQKAYYVKTGGVANTPIGREYYGTPSGAGGYSDYINQMYAAALQSQLAQLEAGYNQNISELDSNVGKTKDTYTEQKRQTTGTNAQDAAAWREMANAMGLNTGTVGQAALAQNNQLQSNLNALENAEAAALTEIERQKALLGQNYQLQINQAIADNDFQKAQALYNEAVRAQEQLMQQQQYASQMALQYAQLAQNQYQYENDLALKYAKAGLLPAGQTEQQYILAEIERATEFANAMSRSNQGADIIAKNLKNNGYSSDAILKALLNSGYSLGSIDAAFNYAGY